jgi:GMP synthase (glutamine-hydrolysing)
MKSVLIIKTGSTVKSVPAAAGDFEDWIIAAMQGPNQKFIVADVCAGEELPDFELVKGIVVTGSPAMVTDKEVWSENAANYLRHAVAQKVPTLGICYGHQLLAYALGGVVGFHPQGREIGTAKVKLSSMAEDDLLFKGMENEFLAHVSHGQTVAQVPEGAAILASNDFEAHHALRFAEKTWGLQFHPEFSAEIMRAYLIERQDDLIAEGFDLEILHAEIDDTPIAEKLLYKFSQIL